MHEEMQLAAMVQREFLPRTLPSLHGFEFGVLWRPAHYVSGDIYDVTRLDENHVGVFVADAVGHGVPAALMTMVIQRTLPMKEVRDRSYRIVPPGEALRVLNEEMIKRQGETTRFATAAYAVINCRTREVTVAAAGHPVPYHVKAGGGLRAVETAGGLLGVFEGEEFEEVTFTLGRGDSLLLYSDGFENAFPSAERTRIPTKKYLHEFEELAECATPEAMIERIGRRVDEQPGSLHQQDDLTFICAFAGAASAAQPASTGGAMEAAA